MQSAGVNNTSKDARTGDSSGEEESDDDEAGPNVEVSSAPQSPYTYLVRSINEES